MEPAYQALHADNAAVTRINLGLVIKFKLAFFQCGPQISYHLCYRSGTRFHFTGIKLVSIPALGLGKILCRGGMLDQRIGFAAIVRVNEAKALT